MAEYKHSPKKYRGAGGGRWQAADDNRIPPADLRNIDEYDEREEAANVSKHDTKVIMAHEFREDPEMFKTIAESVADSYNEAHCLKVGGELPAELEKKEKKDE